MTTALSGPTCRPQSLPGSEHLPVITPSDLRSASTPDLQIREDFLVLAKESKSKKKKKWSVVQNSLTVHTSLKSAAYKLQSERDRFKAACDAEGSALLTAPAPSVVVTLRNALKQALIQNSELKSRLNRVHDIADLADVSSVGPTSDGVRFFLLGVFLLIFSSRFCMACLTKFCFQTLASDVTDSETARQQLIIQFVVSERVFWRGGRGYGGEGSGAGKGCNYW